MPIKRIFAALLISQVAVGHAWAESGCRLPDSFNDPHPVMHDGSRSMFWVRPLQVDADGSRNAYHRDDPHGKKGLAIEYIFNGMTIMRDGKPLKFELAEDDNEEWLSAYRTIVENGWRGNDDLEVDIYGFARDSRGRVCTRNGGQLISSTSLVQYPKLSVCNPNRYVDALKLPGIVVPNITVDEQPVAGADPQVAPPFARNRVSRGDLAIVYNPKTKIWKGAFLYDTGPRHLLGEGSLRLVLDLWNRPKSPVSALETNSLGLVETYTVLFPGTARRMGPGATWTQDKIQRQATELLKAWGGGTVKGGLSKLLGCADAYKAKYH